MKQPTSASSKVVFNTGVLYAKMLITMGISLYSVRLVLNALGESDYGIFNLIAGVIAMLSFLNAAMTVSTQRYLSFHQGTGDFEMQKKVFTNSWILHIGIGIIVVVLLLALSPFLFNGFLNISTDRISAAKAVYYFMTASVFFTIITVPFTASLNAHENMLWIAVVMIIESLLKLGIAISLVYFIETERLFYYGLLTAGITAVSFLLYAAFCLKKYNECNVRNYAVDKPLIKELTGFAGWNLFGVVANAGRVQGMAIILNLFFGTVVNAAYGIANQVASQVNMLSATLLRALNPQIMQSEGANDRQRMLRLSMMASKFGFFLVAIIAIPFIFEMPIILKLWLKNVPDNTVVFCSLILVAALFTQLTVGLQSAMQSTGKIKEYTTYVAGTMLLNLPLAFVIIKVGFPAYYAIITYAVVDCICSVMRLFFAKKYADLSIREYINRVFAKEILPLLLSVVVCFVTVNYIHSDYRVLFTLVFSVIVFCAAIYLFGLCEDEKILVNAMIRKVLRK
ncbi:hypothetical protein FACS1894123_02210 [Bacteroidia bacterium]|nr:hypothetical protein FACS1894123_02210 [Bacteroidia bacterium]